MTIQQPMPATLIPGQVIGPEIVEATLRVLDAIGAPFQGDTQVAGLIDTIRTGDLGRRAGSREFTNALIERIANA